MMRIIKPEKLFHKRLAKGCRQCIYGRKSVLFITSRCHYTCFYCPISDDKREKETVKINEKTLKHPDGKSAINEMIKEIELCQSKGVGITGGDPLATISRTIKYIKALKEHFGKRFHIHLYTSPQFVTRYKLIELDKVGLNEIRFHMNLESDILWNKVELTKGLGFNVGVEVPAVPDLLEESKKLLDFCKKSKYIKFINLNELEYSDAGIQQLKKRGLFTKDSLSYAIKHSEVTAEKLVEYGKSINLRVHYCSAQFKDAIQLGNRLKLRAKSIVQSYEQLDEEGMLVRGEVSAAKNNMSNRKLSALGIKIQKTFSIPKKFFHVENSILFIHPETLKQIWPFIDQVISKQEIKAEIFVEYPTDDRMIVEKTPLK